ncbi:MAG TPA: alpha/beta hydrolase [Terriglobia bacterium]|nr:alpha/beta hydrolase [Terriglobia bacterium]
MRSSTLFANIKVATLAALLALSILALAGIRMPAKDAGPPPLSIAQQGYMFVGGKYSTVKDHQQLSGQLYVEYQIPARRTHAYPIVMIHGLWQSGTNFTGTPDGREGWAQFFLRKGYAVYVVDQPGRGRAAYESDIYPALRQPDLEDVQRRFIAPERYNLWPQAHLHAQWPGKGAPGDPIFDQFYASQLPSIGDLAAQIALTRDAAVALLDKIGPAIVMTHSQSGAFGWPIADARPELVKAIVAAEPSGPPFFNTNIVPAPEWFRDNTMMDRRWGVTDVPLTYAPAVKDPSELQIERQEKPDGPDLVRCWLQKAPARQLTNLQKVPILILTAEASYHAPYDQCTTKFLQQAGAHPTHVRLADAGIHGNGHMMMLEKNSDDIAALISRWLENRAIQTKR